MAHVDSNAMVALRQLSSEGRKTVTGLVNPFQQKSSADPFTYVFRNQSIVARNEISAAGETVICKLPAMGNLVSECYFKINFPSLSTGSYKPQPILHAIERVRIRHGGLVTEYDPYIALGCQLSRCSEEETKGRLLSFFGTNNASAVGGEAIMPVLLPHSVWWTRDINRPVSYDKRSGGLLRTDLLKQELSIEVVFKPLQGGYATNDAVVQGGVMPRLDLVFQELVASESTISKLKTRLPTSFQGKEYIAIKGLSATAGQWTSVEIGAQMARAPTSNIWIRARGTAYSDDKQLHSVSHPLSEYRVDCDGRRVLSTEDESEIIQEFDRFMQGDPGFRDHDPQFCVIPFEKAPFDKKHYSGMISNTACNSVTLQLKFKADSNYEIYFEQCRTYDFKNGTVSVSNTY